MVVTGKYLDQKSFSSSALKDPSELENEGLSLGSGYTAQGGLGQIGHFF